MKRERLHIVSTENIEPKVLLLQKSTIQLLRFRFSFFLAPVFLFALSFAEQIDLWRAMFVFLLIHILLYPASNGYNSYMDRDEGSIGGVEKPLSPTRELYTVTLVMDITGALLSILISPLFACLYVVYIIFSRLYSYRGIRLKQYPFTGYIVVTLNQGALIFYMVYIAMNKHNVYIVPIVGLMVSSLLIGAFYPITQVYQHEQDRKDGVTTISYKLGIKGTFIYSSLLYIIAFALLAWYYGSIGHFAYFIILQAWFLPVIIMFLWWMIKCFQNKSAANFVNTMRMNTLASTCTNLAFVTLIIVKHFG